MRFEQFAKGDVSPGKWTDKHPDHATSFPCCGRYLMYWLSPTTLKDRVNARWTVFVKWCGSEAIAVEACTWGKGPLIQINSTMVGHAMGRTTSDGSEIVCFIHAQVANAFEKGNGWIIWESTVLHEMVHWARGRLRLPQGPKENDVGKQFEEEAYGADVTMETPWRAGP
jgi:hypothetical protein